MADKKSNIKSFEIQAAQDQGRTVDVKEGITSFSYYENILSNHLTFQVSIQDSGNSIEKDGQRVSIVEGLPIRGGEEIRFNVKDGEGTPLKMEMYLNKLYDLDETTTTDSFNISGVSKEFFSNEMTRVVKRYDGKISESVRSILKILDAEISEIEDTANAYNFIGNDKKPFYVGTWLGTKSIPEEAYGETAGFLLYQTQDGMNFRSVDGLLGQTVNTSGRKLKRYIYNSSDGFPRGYDGKIVNYEFNRSVDVHSNLMMGAYNNRTLYFNPYSFVYTHKDFNITEQKKVKRAGKDEKKDWDFIAPEFTESTTRLMTSILDVGTIPSGKDAKAQLEAWVDDKDATNDKVMERMVQSVMRYNQLFSVTTSITIEGDFSLRAGDIIQCDFPRVSGKPEIDKKSSGNYLIATLCHYVNPEHTYTQLGLIRDSYGRKL